MSIFRGLFAVLRKSGLTVSLLATAALIAWAVGKYVIMPGYVDAKSRMYTSRLGYSGVLRAKGEPFPVETTYVRRKTLHAKYLGEGMMRSEPIIVPIVPMARIVAVHAEEGDLVQEGQLLAELSTEELDVKIAAATAAVEAAEGELQRALLGSVRGVQSESLETDRVRVEELRREFDLLSEQLEVLTRAADQGVGLQTEILDKRRQRLQVASELRQAEISLQRAEKLRGESTGIAEATLREARLALKKLQLEREEYQIFSPTDGIIERQLVHAGEYNHDPGKPAFLLASGLWFESYIDQTAYGDFQTGDPAEVHLEALPGEKVRAVVEKIIPIVAYSAGGPETNRPLRPLGTGSPEWPSTFKVRLKIEEKLERLAPGLTGYARVQAEKEALAAPDGAVTSVSGGKAMVFVLSETGFEPREVAIGVRSEGWAEIRSGLAEHDEVIVAGQQVLEPGDAITVVRRRFVEEADDEKPEL